VIDEYDDDPELQEYLTNLVNGPSLDQEDLTLNPLQKEINEWDDKKADLTSKLSEMQTDLMFKKNEYIETHNTLTLLKKK